MTISSEDMYLGLLQVIHTAPPFVVGILEAIPYRRVDFIPEGLLHVARRKHVFN